MTLEQLQHAHKEAIQDLVKEAGTIIHLAKMLDKPFGTVQGWVERGRISKEGARLVESHPTLGDKFKAKDLRPEL